MVIGDFNLEPDTQPIAAITGAFQDSREVAKADPYGPVGTFNGFDKDHPLDRRIDYIFISPEASVRKYGCLADLYDGKYPSDHLPVWAEIFLATP